METFTYSSTFNPNFHSQVQCPNGSEDPACAAATTALIYSSYYKGVEVRFKTRVSLGMSNTYSPRAKYDIVINHFFLCAYMAKLIVRHAQPLTDVLVIPTVT